MYLIFKNNNYNNYYKQYLIKLKKENHNYISISTLHNKHYPLKNSNRSASIALGGHTSTLLL